MKILASGRDGDIFEYAPGLVLRRTRDGRSIAHEARIMRYVEEQGYPVPHVEEVRADGKLRHLPFIMITAESKTENVIAAKQAGVSNYIVKPFNAETLREKIEKVLVHA